RWRAEATYAAPRPSARAAKPAVRRAPRAFVFAWGSRGRPPHRLDPAHALAKRSDLRYVVTAVPGIETEVEIDRHASAVGLHVDTPPVGFGQRVPERHPARVQSLEQGERRFDGGSAHVAQLGPALLLVGLDGRRVLGERE